MQSERPNYSSDLFLILIALIFIAIHLGHVAGHSKRIADALEKQAPPARIAPRPQ